MKINKNKPLLLSASFFVLISIISLLLGCGEGEPNLVGKWIPESGGKAPEGFPDDLELFKDGTGICEKISINWKVDNNRFVVTSSLAGFAMNYKISESTLTLTDDNGQSVEYGNLKKREEAKAAAIGSLNDKRDGKTYKTIKIGKQTWMAENLNYEIESSSKCYDNNPVNCNKYGRLYDWNTAMKSCPSGWHLPTNIEWDKLYRFVDGTSGTDSPYKSETAGRYLKATNDWNKNGNGTDTHGFAALPGGYGGSNGNFYSVSSGGFWWSASENIVHFAYGRFMLYDLENASYSDDYDWNLLFSIRCLKD